MKLKEAVARLQTLIPLGQAEDFDNVGLLCGVPERELTGMLVAHDALEEVVYDAVAQNVNLIVCFHPIIFSGLKSITGKDYMERAVLTAIEHKIAIYSVHTAYDNDYYGVNFGICEALQLSNQRILMPKKNNLQQLSVYTPAGHEEKVREAVFAAGAGHIGFYDECSFQLSGHGTFRPLPGSNPVVGQALVRETAVESVQYFIFEKHLQRNILTAMKQAHPYEEVAYHVTQLENENQYSGLGRYGELVKPLSAEAFLRRVQQVFGTKMIRHSAITAKTISRVAVLGGSGASGIRAALAAGCDAYVTADLKYHDFFQAEGRMLLCDIGHFESEQFVTRQLYRILNENFPKFAVLKSTVNTNPVKYFI